MVSAVARVVSGFSRARVVSGVARVVSGFSRALTVNDPRERRVSGFEVDRARGKPPCNRVRVRAAQANDAEAAVPGRRGNRDNGVGGREQADVQNCAAGDASRPVTSPTRVLLA